MGKLNQLYKLARSKFNQDSAQEMGWVFFGQSANVILGFVIIKYLSGLGKAEYGKYALIITIAALLGLFYGPLQQGFIRFYYHYQLKKLTHAFTKYTYKILFTLSLTLLIITLLCTAVLPQFELSITSKFILTAGIFLVVFKVNEFFNSVLNLIRKRKENSLLQAAEKTLVIISFILVSYFGSLKLLYALIILGTFAFVFASTKIILFQKLNSNDKDEIKSTNSYSREIRSQLFTYALPFLTWGIFGWLQLNSEKWIINGVLSTAEVGVYAIMIALVNALVLIPNNIIAEFATPIIFKQFSDLKNEKEISTGYSYIKLNVIFVLSVTLFSTLLTFFFGKQLIVIISNESYTNYWFILPLLCLGTGMFLIGQALTYLGMSLNLPQKYLPPKISVGCISVLLNLFFINKFGIVGVSYSVLLVGLIYVVYILIVNKKITIQYNINF